MARIITQVLVGLMLLFGVVTLLPKSYIEFRAKRPAKGLLYALLGLLALYFSSMAFFYAYLNI
ncbi:MAG: hypothetical protein A2X59_12965 [Nitrospirae bacterium GWC2_42_7]|nr:MAG: hypothetical protein A2X59_12965 [Nitrospirae bacterium GWC2_42_7]